MDDNKRDIKDEVIRDDARKTDETFKKTLPLLVDRKARSDEKTDYLFNVKDGKLPQTFYDATKTIAAEFDRRSSELDEKGLADEAYVAAKIQLRDDNKRTLNELHGRFIKSMQLAGGKDKKIETEEELLDFVEYGQDILYDINFGELVNSATGKRYFDKADEKNKPLMEILSRMAEGQEPTKQDYELMASRIDAVSKMGSVDDTKQSMKKFLNGVSNMSEIENVFSVVNHLKPEQRYKLGQALLGSKDGAQTIFTLTKTGFFSVNQTSKLFDENRRAVPAAIYKAHKDALATGEYIKSQQAMEELRQQYSENLKKHMHENFIASKLTYGNGVAYYVGLKAIGSIIFLNAFVNIKNKDYAGMLINVPMWAGLAASAAIYDDFTEGELRQMASKRPESEQTALDNTRKKEVFGTSLNQRPELAKWFRENITDLNKGFGKINPEGKEGYYKFDNFADLGVKDPGMKDRRQGALVRQTVTEWYEYMTHTLHVSTDDQKKYLEELDDTKTA